MYLIAAVSEFNIKYVEILKFCILNNFWKKMGQNYCIFLVQNIPLCTWMYLYMVGPSHKVSSRRETDGRQMSFRSWTLQLIKCLNGVGNFICCKMLVMSFHNECFWIFNIKGSIRSSLDPKNGSISAPVRSIHIRHYFLALLLFYT